MIVLHFDQSWARNQLKSVKLLHAWEHPWIISTLQSLAVTELGVAVLAVWQWAYWLSANSASVLGMLVSGRTPGLVHLPCSSKWKIMWRPHWWYFNNALWHLLYKFKPQSYIGGVRSLLSRDYAGFEILILKPFFLGYPKLDHGALRLIVMISICVY